jgi:hypothetical protein
VIDYQELIKISENYCFVGEFKGAKPPQSIKMGIYKAKPYFQGGWEKYRSNLNSRIIGQINFTIL